MGLPRQSVPTGCLLGQPVAVTIGEAILDGVEAALVTCRGRRQELHSEGRRPEREEGTVPVPAVLLSLPHCPVGLVGVNGRREPQARGPGGAGGPTLERAEQSAVTWLHLPTVLGGQGLGVLHAFLL